MNKWIWYIRWKRQRKGKEKDIFEQKGINKKHQIMCEYMKPHNWIWIQSLGFL